ncbi:type II toxin-antitoxin system CcdA family antitoxin [Andreesenia angusta]
MRKNVSIPSWLNEMAKNQGINFSQVLQDALKSELDID